LKEKSLIIKNKKNNNKDLEKKASKFDFQIDPHSM